MTRNFHFAILVLVFCALAPVRVLAQDNAAQQSNADKATTSKAAPQGMQRLTGCILRGDITDNYKFNAKDGTVWDIEKTNKNLKIDPYVGHTVTLVGSVTPNPRSAKDDPNAGKIKRDLGKNKAGTLEISRFTKKGAACTQ
jgi:hypothetical protein